MGNSPGVRNIVVIGIFFLIISSTLVSSNTIGGLTEEEESVTMTSQVYGFTEDATSTVRVTKKQLQEIHTIFDTLQDRLSTTESQEETQRIFDETIIELDRYHLLPDGMSIAHAQRLVNHALHFQRTVPSIEKLSRKFQGSTAAGTLQNSFCSVAGNTSNTHFAKLAKRTALCLYYIIDYNTGNVVLNKIATTLYVIFRDISKINQLFLRQNGYHVGVCLYYGNYHYAPYPNWESPATGWLSTDGMNGKQNITGSFWGQTMTGGWQPQVDWYMNYSWRGCLGFTGLILYDDIDTAYYLGSALAVNVGPNQP